MRRKPPYFTAVELSLWSVSSAMIVLTFCLFDRENLMTLAASLIGVASLIFSAKGNPLGQLLMVVFSIVYGGISYSFAYYGEMITYLGMTLPMSAFALFAWLQNPYKGRRAQVKIRRITRRESLWMWLLTAAVTCVFGFVLAFFNTANLAPSILSVTTSFIAVYLSFRRDPRFALAYAANDVVLIVLWILASMQEMCCLSVVVCFTAFLANDLYGFLNWRKMERKQAAGI